MNPESPRFDTETGKRLEQFPPVSKLEPPTLDLKIKKTQMSNDREDQRLDLEESPDVKEVVFPSQLLSGEPYMNAEKNAKEKFANEYPEDSKKYAEKEKVRIYDDPSTDPAYKSLEAEILASANEAISYGRKRGWIKDADEERRIWNREYDRKNQFGWSRFVTLYPEKAAAYAAKNELIA